MTPPPPGSKRPEQHDDFTLGSGGGDEVVVVPWTLLLRRRVGGVRYRLSFRRRYQWMVLYAVLAGLFSVNITFTLFAVAQERIARDLGTDTAGITLAISLPLLAYGVAAPAMGKVSDLFGHRRVFLCGMVGAMVAAALSAVAPNVGALIGVRLVGQVVGAATGSASMALIFSVFDRDDRVKAMGWWSLIGAGGPVIGVVVGGAVIDSVGWRAMFWAQVPMALVATSVAVFVLPPSEPVPPDERGRFDVAGALLLGAGVGALLMALNRGPAWGWTAPVVLAGFVVAPVMLALFVRAERRAADPLLPLHWFARRGFTLSIAAQALGNFAYMGGFILAPLLLSRVYGFSESKIGLVSVARPFAFSICAPVAGYLGMRIGERWSAVAGTSFIVASMGVFASLGAGSPLAMVVTALALSGIGMGVASPALAAAVANVVEESSMGVASAAQQLVTQVGLVAGIQLVSTVQAAREPLGLVESFGTAYLVGGAGAVAAVACSLAMPGLRRDRPEPVGEPLGEGA